MGEQSAEVERVSGVREEIAHFGQVLSILRDDIYGERKVYLSEHADLFTLIYNLHLLPNDKSGRWKKLKEEMLSKGNHKEVADALLAERLFSGTSVLEIGGWFAHLLYRLGAQVTLVEPRSLAFNEEKEGFKHIRRRVDPADDIFGNETFDITLSSLLMTRGIGAYTDEQPVEPEEMMRFFAKHTESGGLSVHKGDKIPTDPAFLAELGFSKEYELKEGSPGVLLDVYAFSKE